MARVWLALDPELHADEQRALLDSIDGAEGALASLVDAGLAETSSTLDRRQLLRRAAGAAAAASALVTVGLPSAAAALSGGVVDASGYTALAYAGTSPQVIDQIALTWPNTAGFSTVYLTDVDGAGVAATPLEITGIDPSGGGTTISLVSVAAAANVGAEWQDVSVVRVEFGTASGVYAYCGFPDPTP